MESKSAKKVHLFRSKSEILRLLREMDQGDVSIQAFCAANNISVSNIARWRRKYGHSSGAVTPVQNFTRLEVTSSVAASVGLFAEVNGIKIYQPVSAFYLKELIS